MGKDKIEKMIEAEYLCLNCGFMTDSRIRKTIHEIAHPLHLVGNKIRTAEFRHGCGCVTMDKNGVIEFVNKCNLHKKSGRVWIALQHPKKK